jgi:Zn-dependent protease with chaperone function
MSRFLLLLAILAGCASLDATNESHTAADQPTTAGDQEPVIGNAPFFWAVTDYSTFKRIAQAPPFRVGAPLAADDNVTLRLQAWADRLHDAVAADVLASTGEPLIAPRPTIVVVPSRTANAWVSGIPICLTTEPADLAEVGGARPTRTARMVFVENGRLREAFSLFGAPPQTCATAENWPGDLDAAIAFVNAHSACKIDRAGGRLRVSGADCAIETAGPTTANQLTYYVTSPYIHFTTAMLALAADEHNIVGVITHELGHYYRAHAVSDLVMAKYNFWFEESDPPTTAAPQPVADTGALDAQRDQLFGVPFITVTGQQLSPRLNRAVVAGISQLLPRLAATPGAPCADAVAELGDWTEAFRGLGGTSVVQRDAERYLRFEAALRRCDADVPVTVSGGDGALQLAAVQAAVSEYASAFASPPLAAGSLREILDELHARASVRDRAGEDLFATIEARRLGFYTAEQEADAVSLRYYAELGLEPQTRIDGYLDLVRSHPELSDPSVFAARNGGMSLATCDALYAADWTTIGADGTPVPAYVPLGELTDPHHGDCYRRFSLSQVLRAYGYEPSGTPPAFAGPWEDVRAAAQALTDAIFVPPGGVARAPMPGLGGAGGTIFE